MRKLLPLLALGSLTLLAAPTARAQFINEFSYDCSATDDAGCEFVEVALPSSALPADYAVYFYNGNGGSVYNISTGTNDATGTANVPLSSFTVGASRDGFTLYTFAITAPALSGGRFQNGAPDGLALVNTTTSTISEFLSYEGVATATNGPANGTPSTDVLPGNTAPQSNTTAPTLSISRQSAGPTGTFAVVTATSGALNTGQSNLPVELVAFTAASDGAGVLLRWTTASETNNAGFSVEARANGAAAWTAVGFEAGRGTTLEASSYAHRVAGLAAGRYSFRLRQTDFDGASSYSAEVEAEIGMTAPVALGVRGQREVRFAVREAQTVRVAVYNALGQRVANLFDGAAEAGAETVVGLEGAALPAGAYFVRLEGARATATRSLVVR